MHRSSMQGSWKPVRKLPFIWFNAKQPSSQCKHQILLQKLKETDQKSPVKTNERHPSVTNWLMLHPVAPPNLILKSLRFNALSRSNTTPRLNRHTLRCCRRQTAFGAWTTYRIRWPRFERFCVSIRVRTNSARAHLHPFFSRNSKNSKTWKKNLEKIGCICIQVLHTRVNSQNQMTFYLHCTKKTK